MTPYTYLIGWSTHDKWYYGSRTAKTCHPDDLWVSYFTSSRHVKTMREQFGEPDVIQIRKTFTNRDQCLTFEHRVLQRMKVTKSPKWINKTDVKCVPPLEAAKAALNRRWYTNGTENLYLDPDKESIPTGFMRGRRVHWLGEPSQRSKVIAYTNGVDVVYAATLEERPLGKEWKKIPVRQLLKGKRKHYTNGVETKLLLPNEVPFGWSEGRHWSNAGENNAMYGRTHREESKLLMSKIKNKNKTGVLL